MAFAHRHVARALNVTFTPGLIEVSGDVVATCVWVLVYIVLVLYQTVQAVTLHQSISLKLLTPIGYCVHEHPSLTGTQTQALMS